MRKGYGPAPPKEQSSLLKAFPIIISSIALVISFLGWNESHQGRILSEAVNRPVIDLQTISITFERGGKEEAPEVIFHVGVKNIGKTTAMLSGNKVDPLFFGSVEGCKMVLDQTPYDIAFHEAHALEQTLEIAPGIEETISGHASLTAECKAEAQFKFSLFIVVSYVDEPTGKDYSQIYFRDVVVPTQDLSPSPSPSPQPSK